METVGAYVPQQFDSLPTFREARENLHTHRSKLNKFGRVLHAHNLSDRLGLALLHRHFDLAPDEILVEKIDVLRGESVGAPRNAVDSGAILPHLFRVSINENDGSYIWFPLEFADVSDDDGTLAGRYQEFTADEAFLNDFAATVFCEGAAESIGVALFHGREEIHCKADEVLNESTDEIRRTLVMRPAKRTDIGRASTPTLWRFDGRNVLMSCTCQTDPDGDHAHRESN